MLAWFRIHERICLSSEVISSRLNKQGCNKGTDEHVVQITHFDLLSDGRSTLEVYNGHCRYPLIQALPA